MQRLKDADPFKSDSQRRHRVAITAISNALLLGVAVACAGGGTSANAGNAPAAPRPSAPLAVETMLAVLDQRVPALLGRYGVASVSMALIVDGRVALERAYGEQSAGVPATPNTLYGLASVTKPISAEVLLR